MSAPNTEPGWGPRDCLPCPQCDIGRLLPDFDPFRLTPEDQPVKCDTCGAAFDYRPPAGKRDEPQ